MTHLELRKKFFDYFKSKNHEIVASSSLIPIDDPSLLFTTAGMLQFKPLYAGIKKSDYTRAATIQKCFRLSDLENIGGITARHHTFFEMFGNFSFSGDYFKKEAIDFAWEFSTEVIKLPKEKIYISIYENDDDAFELWNKRIGVPKDKIVRLGKKDNFWGPAGDSGACGPCSELYIDMGEHRGCGKETCYVGCDCDRYLEFWNLVFNEFFQDVDGNFTPLPNVGIDTGMGLERLACITQGVESNYQTDVMKPIVDSVMNKLNISYNDKTRGKINLISDHIRALVFVISDGVIPSNEGRGYVLKRLLRRALKAAGDLGYKKSFLNEITNSVTNVYKDIYSNLKEEEANVKSVLLSEENKFYSTLSSGLNKLNLLMEGSSGKIIKGEDIFTLFDTYGLPYEITEEEAGERGFKIDKEGFEKCMESQRVRSRGLGVDKKIRFNFVKNIYTNYVGEDYDAIKYGVNSKIVALYSNEDEVKSLDTHGFIITDTTPFYGEMGGQVGDSGYIEKINGEKIKIVDTQKHNDTTILIVECDGKKIEEGESVKLFVDLEKRNAVRKNHTATHILQRVLEITLGSHVNQAGSYVSENYLRFDFTHPKAITESEITEIEDKVNKIVFDALPCVIKNMAKEEAIAKGAKALFGEKYADVVRTLTIGEKFSMELCGGSHLTNTSEIGYFHIVSEGSIASGVRRIEAITGLNSSKKATETFKTLKSISHLLGNIKQSEINEKIVKLGDEIKKLQKENKVLKTSGGGVKNFLDNYIENDRIKIYNLFFEEDIKSVKAYADTLKDKVKDHFAVILSSFDNVNTVIVQVVGIALEKKISASSILKEIIEYAGGRGGGKDNFAQGSVVDLNKAKEKTETIIKNIK